MAKRRSRELTPDESARLEAVIGEEMGELFEFMASDARPAKGTDAYDEIGEKFLKIVWKGIRAVHEKHPFVDIYESLLRETDRGCVIVAAQIVDEELESLIREFCHLRSGAGSKEMDFWFKGQLPPLRSTALKIHLSFALGLINDSTRNALEALQNLRSRMAAHSRKIFQLEAKDSRSILKKMDADVQSQFENELASGRVYDQHGAFGPLSDEKCQFYWVAMQLFAQIEEARKRVGRQSVSSPFEYPRSSN